MKNSIPRYTFHKNKYGSELLIDVVELKYVKKFLAASPVHTLTYYDITFITEGEGSFSIDNRTYEAFPQDVFFSKAGEIRNWDTHHISNGYALIFEDEFLSSLFRDSMFVRHLAFFKPGKSAKLHLSDELYTRVLQVLHNIKMEIDSYKQNDVHVLRALLYEVLMLLERAYQKAVLNEEITIDKEINNIHIDRFIHLVGAHLKEQHSVQFYADKLCITPNYLNEIITSVMGLSAKRYIQNQVIDEAKKLLAYTDVPISDIAFELHFSTVSYFIRCFRQHTGETPLLFRKKYKP
ncbi:AraC family transcriptional regulator [uncultured Bacteroides sp.]|uniref:AraC family transcriptional regulator n=1 Tax=uncultured Bacteroides sp. TaxID=162156 RepID=UPI00280AD101|nr:AraC family transcriptional regulator [uncultured Bacteroides sp.]